MAEHFERLSGLDAAFLGFETASTYMHVAATAIFDAGPLRTATGGIDMDRIRRHFAARLSRLPRFRQRIEFVPYVQDPVWVDDERFDLGYHLRHASLPRPGTTEQLQRSCAEILERPLNRQHPLWEAWVVEGLADDAFALIVKVHHCIVDGIAGIGMLVALLDPTAVDVPGPAEPWTPRPSPAARTLLRAEALRRVEGSGALVRSVAQSVLNPAAAVSRWQETLGGALRLVRNGLSAAPLCEFNRAVGPHRRVAWFGTDLARIKQAKDAFGGTVNDVVLTAVGGALGQVLRARRDPIGEGEIRVVVPVSVRSAAEFGAPGNHVSLWLVPLPLGERDPARRFARVHGTTSELKRGHIAAGGTIITEAASWAGGAVVALGARMVGAAHLYNLIVTNVPGPDIPLYLLGARLRAAYPHLPLFEHQGLGVALLSYRGVLHVGITADWEHGAVLSAVTDALAEQFEALFALADPQPLAGTRRVA